MCVYLSFKNETITDIKEYTVVMRKKCILKFIAYNEDIIFNEILKLTLICCNLSRFSAMERNLMFQRSLHIMRYLYNLTSYI